jgi:hypothetical protein
MSVLNVRTLRAERCEVFEATHEGKPPFFGHLMAVKTDNLSSTEKGAKCEAEREQIANFSARAQFEPNQSYNLLDWTPT